MANPNGGNAAASSLLVYNGSGAFAHAKPNGLCVDNTGTYAYLLIGNWFGAATTLNGAVTSGATSIVLTSATNYQTAGFVTITDNSGNPLIVQYTGISTNTLTGCTGVTENLNSGNAVVQSANITQIQLSNLTATGQVFPLQQAVNQSNLSVPFYDAVNSLILYIDNNNKLWSLPASGGSSPWTLTQVGSGALSPPTGSTWGGLTFDSSIGIVWNCASTISAQVSGFYYLDPLSATANFVAAYHPMVFGNFQTGESAFLPGSDALAWTPGAARFALCQGNNFVSNTVMRYRNDLYKTDVIADGAGATNSTNNGATPGTTVTNPTCLVYDSQGSGRLYIFAGTNMYYADPTTEILTGGPIAITATTGIRNARYLGSGGYTGGSATTGQIIFLDGAVGQGTLRIIY